MTRWQLHNSDALESMSGMDAASFDAVLCDPPYGLGFMGKAWDHGVPSVEVWAEVLRVLKPGAFLLAFGGTRTFHRLTCAIEDAGFEIRDCVSWLYGSGFPKSMDISKALDKAAGVEREVVGTQKAPGMAKTNVEQGAQSRTVYEFAKYGAPATDAARTWEGYGTALKPAWEPCIVAMKPLDGTFAENALEHGVAGLNIEAGRVDGPPVASGGATGWAGSLGGLSPVRSEGHPSGRWPANLILDPEAGAMLDAQTGTLKAGVAIRSRSGGLNCHSDQLKPPMADLGYPGDGGASRFFYCAKASRQERDAGLREAGCSGEWGSHGNGAPARNNHPCLKPLDLNRYLASLILPPKRDTPRRILVPFSGSGSEMIGALLAGWDEAVGIEREADYCAIAEARLNHWCAVGPLLEAMA